jgi:hypothetical protein
MLCFLSLAAGNDQTESFWKFLLHPVVVAGMVAMFGGIVVGNMGIWRMMDAAEEDIRVKHEMFSTGDATSPRSPSATRAAAVKKYRETQPDGPFYKMLRIGQILTVVGVFVMLIGALQLVGAFS